MNNEKNNRFSIPLVLLGALIGALAGYLLLGGMTQAMANKSPGFWFVSRAAAVVGYLLLWASTAWGILISSKAVKDRVPGPLAFTLHNVTAWAGMGFGALHAWALLGDRIVPFSLTGVLVPFMSTYHPVLTGLGTLSLYTGLLVSLSFYFTKRIGHRAWRIIHLSSYLMFVWVTVHGVALGTDSRTLVMQMVYLVAGGSVLFLTLLRVLMLRAGDAPHKEVAPKRQRGAESAS
jgi:sulfoxide reductase heme-binding subunit YedZ